MTIALVAVMAGEDLSLEVVSGAMFSTRSDLSLLFSSRSSSISLDSASGVTGGTTEGCTETEAGAGAACVRDVSEE